MGLRLFDYGFKVNGVYSKNQKSGETLARKIASKFIGFETFYLNKNDPSQIQKLTWVWCTKEALYKLYGKPGTDFKKHLIVLPFSTESNNTIAWIVRGNRKLKFVVTFMEFEGFGCVVTEPEI